MRRGCIDSLDKFPEINETSPLTEALQRITGGIPA